MCWKKCKSYFKWNCYLKYLAAKNRMQIIVAVHHWDPALQSNEAWEYDWKHALYLKWMSCCVWILSEMYIHNFNFLLTSNYLTTNWKVGNYTHSIPLLSQFTMASTHWFAVASVSDVCPTDSLSLSLFLLHPLPSTWLCLTDVWSNCISKKTGIGDGGEEELNNWGSNEERARERWGPY